MLLVAAHTRMFKEASTLGSLALSLLYATGIVSPEKGAPSVQPSAHAQSYHPMPGFETNVKPDDAYACDWWSVDVERTYEESCSMGNLRLAMTSVLHESISKATRCAQATGETCILSHEVGLTLPAVFVWNHDSGTMKPLLYPKLIFPNNTYDYDEYGQKRGDDDPVKRRLKRQLGADHVAFSRLRVHHPLDAEASTTDKDSEELIFREQVIADYMTVGHGIVTDTRQWFNGTDAYCLQLLSKSLPSECEN